MLQSRQSAEKGRRGKTAPRPAAARGGAKAALAIPKKHPLTVREGERPLIVVVAAQKGGVGKTTIAMGLAHVARDAGLRVRVLDTDGQGSATKWQLHRKRAELSDPARDPQIKPIPADRELIDDEIVEAAAAGCDLIFIDTAGKTFGNVGAIMQIADVVLVPTKNGAFDLDAINRTLEEAGQIGKLPLVVVNGIPANAQRKMKDLADAIRANKPNVVVGPFLPQRAEVQSAQNAFQTIGESAPDSAAYAELSRLLDYITKMFVPDDAPNASRAG